MGHTKLFYNCFPKFELWPFDLVILKAYLWNFLLFCKLWILFKVISINNKLLLIDSPFQLNDRYTYACNGKGYALGIVELIIVLGSIGVVMMNILLLTIILVNNYSIE